MFLFEHFEKIYVYYLNFFHKRYDYARFIVSVFKEILVYLKFKPTIDEIYYLYILVDLIISVFHFILIGREFKILSKKLIKN